MTGNLSPPFFEPISGRPSIDPWVFNGAASTEEAEGASSGATINMPSHSIGDLLIMWGSAQPGRPTGWTTLSTGNLDCYYKVATSGSEAPVTVVGPPGDEGRFMHVHSYSHSLGLTPTYVTTFGQQRLGSDDFIIPRLIATGSYADVLNVSGAARTGADAQVTPSFVDLRERTTAGDTWYQAIDMDYSEWIPGGTTRFTHMGSAYGISAISSTPATEWRYWFDPFEGAISGQGTQGTSAMFRGA